MQSFKNAGVIVYRDSRLPQLLSAFSTPKLEEKIAITVGEEEHTIFILHCPTNSDKLDKKRYRLIKDLVDKNNIKFLVERFETETFSNVSKHKNEIHYSDLLPEIQAIKQLAVLLKKSQDYGKNLLKGNVGFIMGEINSHKIDLLSEEAENIMFYESPYITEQLKRELHNSLMEKKGVSIIFTKDIKKIINASDILSIDDKIDIYAYRELLQGKIILGKSSHKDIKSIDDIMLWHKDLHKDTAAEALINFNDEILTIIRYFNINLDIIDFVKNLPYIYYQ